MSTRAGQEEVSAVKVRPLERGHEKDAARVLAEAFLDGPLWKATGPRWRRHRRIATTAFFRGELRIARRLGGWLLGVFEVDELLGVMVAFPQGERPVPISAYGPRVVPALIAGPLSAARALRISMGLERCHPRDSHVYCWFMGVRPDTRGVGALLLRTVTDRAARLQKPVYLEAAGRDVAAVYELLGFEQTGEYLLRTGSPQVLMWRPVDQASEGFASRALPDASSLTPVPTN